MLGVRERIAEKVVVDSNGCWLWQGARFSRTGYAQFSLRDKTSLVHRVAYREWRGEIPDGQTIDHLCRVRHCVNPQHLEVVTMRENLMRGEGWAPENARKTECPQGHPYDESNTYVYPSGSRSCRICRAQQDRARKARLKKEAAWRE